MIYGTKFDIDVKKSAADVKEKKVDVDPTFSTLNHPTFTHISNFLNRALRGKWSTKIL